MKKETNFDEFFTALFGFLWGLIISWHICIPPEQRNIDDSPLKTLIIILFSMFQMLPIALLIEHFEQRHYVYRSKHFYLNFNDDKGLSLIKSFLLPLGGLLYLLSYTKFILFHKYRGKSIYQLLIRPWLKKILTYGGIIAVIIAVSFVVVFAISYLIMFLILLAENGI
jgi:hypothetical protein